MANIEQKVDLQLLQPILDEYAAKPGSLITILQHTQGLYGYLPKDALKAISAATGIAPAKILGVASFYTQFRLQPVGKYLIMLCQGTACHVNGSEKISAIITEELGIKDGETTADGLFTLKHVACLGCCSLAPAMMINDEVYGNLTADSVRQVLKDLAAKGGAE
ncbi:MAG: NADH-quinone oxidoreductase subunit NuoE [Firmicutes bacterium]|nr:NADH-quinone oxidoreductase subunit NuoE [Bacillota bacterium]